YTCEDGSVAHKLVCTLALAIALPACTGCTSTSKPVARQQSLGDKLATSVKSGTSKMVAAVSPKSSSKSVPMSSPSGRPGPAVFVAAAQMHESSGNQAEAEANYR